MHVQGYCEAERKKKENYLSPTPKSHSHSLVDTKDFFFFFRDNINGLVW